MSTVQVDLRNAAGCRRMLDTGPPYTELHFDIVTPLAPLKGVLASEHCQEHASLIVVKHSQWSATACYAFTELPQ